MSGAIQDTTPVKKTKLSREEKSWIMYDWANSVYATIMMAAVFPIYFTTVANNSGHQGDTWWGIGTSVAMIIVAVLAPIIGAMADFAGYRKKIFMIFFTLGVGFTLASAFFSNWIFLLLGYAVSVIGFSGSCLIYDSFLSEVTTPERMDKISGYGFAFGYIGGSTIPFLISIALISLHETLGITEETAIRISVLMTAVWWVVFTIPFLKNVRQSYSIEKPESFALFRAAFSSAWDTAKKIFKDKKVFFFIIAYFFYIDGVGTVISMATAYGNTLGLDTMNMVLALLVTQLVAFPCSIWFSSLAQRFGSLSMIRAAVFEYMLICLVGFYMGFGLEHDLFGMGTAVVLFWVLAVLVGTVQGGIQAISRSYFCQMIPPENSGEYFGFFDIFGKFASVLGPLLYSLVGLVTGSPSYAILSVVALFIVGLVMLGICNKHSKAQAAQAAKT